MGIEKEMKAQSVQEAQQEVPKTFSQKLKWVGPGLVVATAAVGSGELINATRLGAIAGLAVLWVVFWGVFLKGFIQQEIGRYTLTTKKTITQGLAEIPGPKIKDKSWFFWLVVSLLALVVLVIISGIGGAIGGVLNVLAPALSASTWGTIAMLSVIPLLLVGTYFSKVDVYSFFEKIMLIMIVAMTIFIVYVAFIALPTHETYSYTLADLFGGMAFELPSGSILISLAVLGTVGAGIELIFYSTWITGKGYLDQAYNSSDNEMQKKERLKSWIGVLKLDTWIGVTFTFFVTMAYFVTGAIVLHALDKVPEGVDVISEISVVITEILGPGFYVLFLIGAFAGLYSTALGIADGTGRMTCDITNEIRGKKGTVKSNINTYRWTIIIVALAWILFYRLISAPTLLITIGGAALSLLFPLYGVALLYLNRQVPKQHQMGWLTKVALLVCFILFTSLWFVGEIFG
ncbi:divalent metal cation transporter [bacterium LRH843]|nr:divalent metal cation transporter [bacterium LRH843]